MLDGGEGANIFHLHKLLTKTSFVGLDWADEFFELGKRFMKDANCHFIKGEYGFTDLLPLADIIVIDFPTTSLLQALTTAKPIFVYTGHLHIDDAPLRLLRRRAYCYPDLAGFTKALDTFLSSGSIDTQVDLKDREFLKMYGTYLDDGKSGVRAANALIKIIKGSKVRVG